MKRNPMFWPFIAIGGLLLFLFGSILLWNTDKIDAEQANNGYKRVSEKTKTTYELEDGVTKPIYPMEEAIIEELYVETEVDNDLDGKLDRVFITVIRPPTDQSMKVPVIYEISPYANIHPSYYYNNLIITGADGKTFIDSFSYLASYYVPRGYAVILGQSLGTANSDGCPTTGDPSEVLAAKSIIDWLNGRAKAFTTDGTQVEADWTTGEVGMTGFSYNGTLANAVASTGVEGLKTIVPIGAISSWYNFFRMNGIPVGSGITEEQRTDRTYQNETAGLAFNNWNKKSEICQELFDTMEVEQDSETFDYNDFWAERNYLLNAKNVKASVLLGHGLKDKVVRVSNAEQWWKELSNYDIPRRMYLNIDGHDDIKTPQWVHLKHRWFDHWLYGIENGVMEETPVMVEYNDFAWEELSDWPDPEASITTLNLTVDGKLTTDTLENKSYDKQSFQGGESMKDFSAEYSPEVEQPNRLIYLTDVLDQNVRMNGTPIVSISASFDTTEGILTAMLVDYGGLFPEIVTRGWIDPQNRSSIEYAEAIVPSEEYEIVWEMEPSAHIFKKGHQIGLVLIGGDRYYTSYLFGDSTVTVTPELSELKLPLIGSIN